MGAVHRLGRIPRSNKQISGSRNLKILRWRWVFCPELIAHKLAIAGIRDYASGIGKEAAQEKSNRHREK